MEALPMRQMMRLAALLAFLPLPALPAAVLRSQPARVSAPLGALGLPDRGLDAALGGASLRTGLRLSDLSSGLSLPQAPAPAAPGAAPQAPVPAVAAPASPVVSVLPAVQAQTPGPAALAPDDLAGLRPAFEDLRRGVEAGDPGAASRLLADHRMLRLLFEGAAAETFEKANALVDLRLVLEAERDAGDLRNALIRRLDRESPLVAAGIGPGSESVLAWTALRSPEKLALARRAALEWDTLDEGQRGWLAGQKRTEERWRLAPVSARAALLAGWAQQEARSLQQGPKSIDEVTLARLRERSDLAAALLPALERQSLELHVERVRLLLAARRALQDGGPREVLDGLDERSDLPVSERLDYLSSALAGRPEFKDLGLVRELDLAREDGEQPAFTDQDRRALADRLVQALGEAAAGTAAGERVRRFYAGGARLALHVRSMPGSIGEFSLLTRDLSLSEEFLQGWLRAERLSLQELLSDPEALRRLARALCPVFVHEATHQMQAERRSGPDQLSVSTQDEEIEAFTAQTLHVLEMSLRDPGTRGQVRPDEAEAADRLREDPALFGRIIRRIYSELPSFEFFAAGALRLAAAMARELARREAHPGSVPAFAWDFDLRAGLERGQFSLSNAAVMSTEGLRQWQGFILRWYAGAAREMAEVRAWAEQARRQVLGSARPASLNPRPA